MIIPCGVFPEASLLRQFGGADHAALREGFHGSRRVSLVTPAMPRAVPGVAVPFAPEPGRLIAQACGIAGRAGSPDIAGG